MEFCNQHTDVIEMKEQVKDIHTALLGDLTDNGEGIKHKVIRHDKYIRAFDKLKWIIISAVAGTVIVSVWGFLL